jgi:SAM-dependent methyltransferase
MNNWINGIPYEIAFWKGVYSNKRSIKRLFNWSKYNKEIELANFDVRLFLSKKENPTVIDAGCGMSFSNGNKLDGKPLNVFYIDPLAPFFNKIIERKKLDLPKITFGFIEYLSAFIPDKASLIIVQNALDHSKNPLKGILECIECLEIGGVLYLKHFRNEAETENYRGFHQYNISTENDDIIIWNKETKTNINFFLKDFAETKTSIRGNEVIAVITKKKELTSGLIDTKSDMVNLSNEYMEIVQNLGRVSYTLSYQWDGFKFHMIQLFMQLFSWKIRQNLKSVIKKITFNKQPVT